MGLLDGTIYKKNEAEEKPRRQQLTAGFFVKIVLP
jgi:hypothetical protein